MLSFVVPAHNEEALLAPTLRTLRASASALGVPYEIIVADDGSTDGTVAIARAADAVVVSHNRRQIAATRNLGARAARGDILIFVDADTHVSARTIAGALDAVRRGAVGGGAYFAVDEPIPAPLARLLWLMNAWMRLARWAAGCFLFVRRDVFEAVGGFDERYYASEEIVLSRALKKRGRMDIVREPVITSARKARLYRPSDLKTLVWSYLKEGDRALQRRQGLEMWYDGRRE